MSFFLFLFHSVQSIIEDGHHDRQYNIPSESEYIFFQCVFSGFHQSAIYYNNEESENCNLKTLCCLFDGIKCQASALYINCDKINSQFRFNAITNCGLRTNNLHSGCFYYRTIQRNPTDSPLFEYLTIYKCESHEKLMNLIGPLEGDNNYFFLSESNITGSYNYDYGLLYMGNHIPFIKHCSFAHNTGVISLIYVEDSVISSFVGDKNIQKCNLVHNKISQFGVICTDRFQNLLVDECIIMNNQLPRDKYNKYDLLVACRASYTYLNVRNSQIQVNTHWNSDNAGGNVDIDNTNKVGDYGATTYAFTFYATHGCTADIPYITPERTKPLQTIAAIDIPPKTPFTTAYISISTPFSTPFSTPLSTSIITPIDTSYYESSSIEIEPSEQISTNDQYTSAFESTVDSELDEELSSLLDSSSISSDDGGGEIVEDPTSNSLIESSSSFSSSTSLITSNSATNEAAEGVTDRIQNNDKNSGNLLYIIIGACIGLIVFIIIIILIIVLRRRNKNNNSSSSNEMDEEDVIFTTTNEVQTINLFTTTAVDDSDPFSQDFEEHFGGAMF